MEAANGVQHRLGTLEREMTARIHDQDNLEAQVHRLDREGAVLGSNMTAMTGKVASIENKVDKLIGRAGVVAATFLTLTISIVALIVTILGNG